MATEVVTVPDLGGAETVDVIEISVKPGDKIEPEQSLLVLESDKATMELPSPLSGKVVEVMVKEGDSVSEGMPLLKVEADGDSTVTALDKAEPAPEEPPAAEKELAAEPKQEPERGKEPEPELKPKAEPEAESRQPEPDSKVTTSPAEPSPGVVDSVYAGPAARQMARKLGVDLDRVEGTGPKGRVLKEDIQQYVKEMIAEYAPTGGSAIPPVADIDFGKFGPVEDISLSKIARLAAANMARNWLNVPHVTQFDDADISEIEDFRRSLRAEAEQRGSKLTLLPFLLIACARGLKANPVLNRSWHSSGERVVQKHYVHIGVAVDTAMGLLVPVIRDVDKKGLWELADEVGNLADKARNGALTPGAMQGGCFSISSLGPIGGSGFTPIVNSPEVAILAVSKTVTKPWWDGEKFVPRKMLPLGLSYDHRLVNGADAGRFLTYVVKALGDMRRLLL